MIICCRYEQDSRRIKDALGKRLAKYHLKLNDEKTRLVRFSKWARRRGDQQEGFDFLGFVRHVRCIRGCYA